MKSDYELKDTDEVLSDNTKLQIGDTVRFIEINESYSDEIKHIFLNSICEITYIGNISYIEFKILSSDNIIDTVRNYDSKFNYNNGSVINSTWNMMKYNLIKIQTKTTIKTDKEMEELNLVEILKNTPKGTPLYSITFGEVTFESIVEQTYPIMVKKHTSFYNFTSDGKYLNASDSECVLFPSKDNRDWDTFNPLIDGEIYNTDADAVFIYKKRNFTSSNTTSFLCGLTKNDDFIVSDELDIWTNRPFTIANSKNKERLLKAIDDNGYEYDPETVTLSKKENICDLKPFDKVLVKDGTDHIWKISLFDRYDENELCYCINGVGYIHCIPYEGNEHLHNTKNNK